jgi:hypothetical protein
VADVEPRAPQNRYAFYKATGFAIPTRLAVISKNSSPRRSRAFGRGLEAPPPSSPLPALTDSGIGADKAKDPRAIGTRLRAVLDESRMYTAVLRRRRLLWSECNVLMPLEYV